MLKKLDHSDGFGEKGISYAAGLILLINNITGPGVPGLSNLYVESGWLPPTICVIVCWGITTLSATMYAEAMANIPGNNRFQGRIEFSTIVEYYFGRAWYIAALVGLIGSLMALVVISVVQSVQVMDNLISTIAGKTCGIDFTPVQNTWTNNSGTSFPVAGTLRSSTSPCRQPHPPHPQGSTDFFSCLDSNAIDMGRGCDVYVLAHCKP